MRISQELRDACEVVHYSMENNTPVDLKYIYKLYPEFNEDID